MPFLLRKIKQSKWLPDEKRTWVTAVEPAADVLTDLQTRDCALSLYRVSDDRSELPHVIAALAAKGTRLDNLDYMLLAEERASALGFKLDAKKPGDVSSTVARALHVDICELSAARL